MKTQHIAIALIFNTKHQILISKRDKKVHQGGLWEFPGGKMEPYENIEEALIRECNEELGIQITAFRPYIQLQYLYSQFKVKLAVYLVTTFLGKPKSREGQPLKWIDLKKIIHYPMPIANQAIIQALHLPECYFITPNETANLLELIQYQLKKGIKLIQLRQKNPQIENYRKIVQLCHQFHCQCLINEDITLAIQIEADGIHLKSSQLFQTDLKIPPHFLIGASCHTLLELKQAEKIATHFAVLSPIKKTTSHPFATPLGFEQFKNWVNEINLPVYGLGGLSMKDNPQIWQNGGQGIAGISCFSTQNDYDNEK